MMTNELAQHTPQGEIILYQPDETVRLEVRLENDTVWLTQAQIVTLFQKSKSTISFHISNVFKEGELDEKVVVRKNRTTTQHGAIKGKTQTHETTYYNLDVIISVGYRVKSLRGTQFRQWATKVLREYLINGVAVNQRIRALESQIEMRFEKQGNTIRQIENSLADHQRKIDFFVQTSLPPKMGIFFDGQVFDAYTLLCQLIRTAKQSIILIDNYIDETVLTLLDKRETGVSATIYTPHTGQQLQLDLQRHNQQYSPITIERFNRSHDRFLIIDDTVYHLGASLKDMGRKWCAIMRMTINKDIILNQL